MKSILPIPLQNLMFILLLCGCETTTSLSEKALLINPGMNKNEVLAVLDKPGVRQFSGNLEAWQYIVGNIFY